jgi:hypothetical protein
MATLTAKLTLTSSNLTSDSLNIALTNILAVSGDTRVFRKVLAVGEDELLTDQFLLKASAYGKSYVLLHNLSTDTSEIITVGLAGNDGTGDEALDTTQIALGSGEFAFFPWDSSIDLVADAASGSPIIEVGVFEVA